VFAFVTDTSLCYLTKSLLGTQYVSVAVCNLLIALPLLILIHARQLTVSLTSFFHSLSLVRSLSNSAETALTTLAFSYFPYNSLVRDRSGMPCQPRPLVLTDGHRTQLRKCICFAALACMMRPTNAIVWMFAFGSLIARSPFDNYTVGLLADLILVGYVRSTSSLLFG
jgi:phosphatidylinositol glycan class B